MDLLKLPGLVGPGGGLSSSETPGGLLAALLSSPPLSSQLLAPPGHLLHLELHRTGNLDHYGELATRRLLCSLTPLTPQVFSETVRRDPFPVLLFLHPVERARPRRARSCPGKTDGGRGERVALCHLAAADGQSAFWVMEEEAEGDELAARRWANLRRGDD